MMIAALLYGVMGLLHILAGTGLFTLKSWGRILQIVVAIVGLCGIPFGTVLSILVLVYLFKPGARVLFSGRSPSTLSPAELSEVGALRGSGVGTAIVVLAIVMPLLMLLIIPAIAIPSLLRARLSANESATVGDIRTVISAEATYQATTGGYGTLECLGAPETCSAQMGASPLLSAELASGAPLRGYQRTFHPGPVGPQGMYGFAYVAVPVVPGRTGIRGFCGDARGIICQTSDGTPPAVVDGTCDETSCEMLGR
jgi:hypothetical protein